MRWEEVLKALKAEGVDSVMIEGGATVIKTLLVRSDLVNSVIVTIAPTWLGQGGLVASPSATTENGQRVNAARLRETAWRQFGADAVLCGRLGG
jgi:2,5-diamino-6-(ribosylamino)-4(3H)-pyrimidinone 5'-phosphate reductase